MKNQRSTKLVAIITLVVAICSISVAFAAMSTTLRINGTAEVQTAEWSIKFDTLSSVVVTGDAAQITAPTLSDTNIGTFKAKLTKPGDSVSYTFNVTNSGSMAAKIGTLTKDSFTCSGLSTIPADATSDANSVCNNLKYTLTYTSGGSPVATNDTLTIGQSRNLTLKLEYDSLATTLPTDDVSVTGLGITIIYVQD